VWVVYKNDGENGSSRRKCVGVQRTGRVLYAGSAVTRGEPPGPTELAKHPQGFASRTTQFPILHFALMVGIHQQQFQRFSFSLHLPPLPLEKSGSIRTGSMQRASSVFGLLPRSLTRYIFNGHPALAPASFCVIRYASRDSSTTSHNDPAE